MLKIQVNSLPVDEVIRDIGKTLGVKVFENCGELKLKIPESVGVGYISGIQFNNGKGLIQYDCKFYQDTEIMLLKGEIHPLKFMYVLKGNLKHRFSNVNNIHEIGQFQHAIIASQRTNGHILKFKEQEKTCFSSIEINRQRFKSEFTCNLKGVSTDLSKVFFDFYASNSFYYKGYYSLKIADIINELKEFNKRNFIRKLFLEGYTIQMLAEEILQYEDAQKEDDKSDILTRYELGAVRDASRFIESNIYRNLLVKDVSMHVGINQNKLQNGFKNLYGSTVHEFIKQHRLQLVKDLLLNTDLQMGEISDRVGISSKSYFSKLFKERYGLSPKQFKKMSLQSFK